MQAITQLADWLRGADAGVVFTGAGISTESGIPDFRSPGGIWSRTAPVMYDDFVRSRAARARYWKQRVAIYRDFAAAKPNAGHRAVARLEALGRVVAVVTQNIDGLHQLAGTRRVLELHGTARVVACIACGKAWPPEAVHAMVDAGDDAPDCDACGAPLKSKTISFGQAMPEDVMIEARRLSLAADLYLAIGSSLVVHPAASLPLIAKRGGARLVIVNNAPTPLDDMADLVIREPIGDTMTRVMARIDGPGAPP